MARGQQMPSIRDGRPSLVGLMEPRGVGHVDVFRSMWQVGHGLDRALVGLTNALGLLSAGALLALILMSSADVLARHLAGSNIRGTIEYGEMLIVALALFGFAITQRTGQHVSVDFVTMRLPRRVRAAAEAISYLAFLFFLAWGVRSSMSLAFDSLFTGETRVGVARVQVWPARFAVSLGLFVLLLEVVRDIVRKCVVAGRRDATDEAATRTTTAIDGV